MSRSPKDLIKVWADTKTYFENKQLDITPSTKYDIHNLDIINNDNNYDCIVEIENKDTLNMAMEYVNGGYNPLVLNMASSFRPGGGVKNGKTAQEEEIFRRSNCHQVLPNEWYPLDDKDVIYSPSVTVCKDSSDKNYKNIKNVSMSMIAVAAIRNPRLNNDKYVHEDYHLMYDKIEAIFKVGILNGHDSLVLGALGCGAYNNPPSEVSNIFKILLCKYKKYFKRIGFAILVVRNGDKSNLELFKKIV